MSVGVSKFIAYRWFREGTLPVPAQRVGRLILIDMGRLVANNGRTEAVRCAENDVGPGALSQPSAKL